MFTEIQSNLFTVKNSNSKKSVSSFVDAAMEDSSKVYSENGSLKYSETSNPFVTQFGLTGSYKELRSFNDISSDMSTLYGIDKETAIKFTLYLRTITRECKLFDGNKTDSVQRGGGLKHEAIMRMIWLAVNDKTAFWKNIKLFIAVGSWKDIFDMLRYDLIYNGWDDKVLNWNELSNLILAGLENPETSSLVKKYLPTISAKSKCTTVRKQANVLIGKFLCNKLTINYEQYRKIKNSGTCHLWQQLISKQLYNKIDFNSIHGRALTQLVSGKFLSNHNLESVYEQWVESKPVAKFTGYVHELMNNVSYSLKPYQKMTINKQFDGLIETAKKNMNNETSFIVVRDTSGSMSNLATGTNMSCGNVTKALALYFSSLLKGDFADAWIEFNSTALMHKWKGSNAVEKWLNDSSCYYGSTNFLSVANLFAKLKSKEISESEFPTGILCISDGEFNASELNVTNVEAFKTILLSAGFSNEYVDNFKIVLWNLQRNSFGYKGGDKFETYSDEASNVFYFSGYEASVIAFLTGTEDKTGKVTNETPKNAKELFDAAMNQEILNMVSC